MVVENVMGLQVSIHMEGLKDIKLISRVELDFWVTLFMLNHVAWD